MTVTLITQIKNYQGLSTDSKPTGIPVGSTFWETDTKKYYKYNGSLWVPDLSLIALSDPAGLPNLPGQVMLEYQHDGWRNFDGHDFTGIDFVGSNIAVVLV